MAIGIVNSGGGTAVKVDGASVGTLDITKLTTWNNDLIDIIDAPVTDDKGNYSVYNIGGDMYAFFRGINSDNNNYYKMFKYDDTNKNWIDVSERYPIYGTSIVENNHDILSFKHNGETYSAYFDRDPSCSFLIPVNGKIFSSVTFTDPNNKLVIRNETTGVLTNIPVSQLFAPALTGSTTVQKQTISGILNAKFVSAGRIYFGLLTSHYSSSSASSTDKSDIAIVYYDIDTRTTTALATKFNLNVNEMQSNYYTMACWINSGSPGCATLFKGTALSGGSLTLEDTTFFTAICQDSNAPYICGFPAVLPSDKKTLALASSSTALNPYSNSSEKFYINLNQIVKNRLYSDVSYQNSSAKMRYMPTSYRLCYDEPYLYIIWRQNINYSTTDNNTQTSHVIAETVSQIKSDAIYKSTYAISRHRVTKRLDSEYDASKACSLYYMDDLNPLDADESGLFTVNGKSYQLFNVLSSDGISLNSFIKAITVHNNRVYVIFDKIYEQGLYYRDGPNSIHTKTDPLTNLYGVDDIYQHGTGSEAVILRAGDNLYGYTLEHPMGKALSNKCAIFELPWNSSNRGSAHTLLNE